MNITLNGEPRELTAPTSIEDLLAKLQLHPEAVVVEVNTMIVPRQTFAHCELNDGDRIEIIRFVGGG